MITVMGIDQSLTCTGVVVSEFMVHLGHREDYCEVVHSAGIKTEKWGKDYILDAVERGSRIADRLIQIAVEHGVEVICFESLSLGSKGNATRTLPILLGVILRGLEEVIRKQGIKVYHLAPMTLKKLATGSGNASKDMMFDSLKSAYPDLHEELLSQPKNIGRYDITDAFFLAREGYRLHKSNQ